MNDQAVIHLAKAKDYVAKGEEFYRKAAKEIAAAQEADPQLSKREIGEWFERGEDWVREIVRWGTNPEDTRETPFGLKADPTQRERNARATAKKPEGAAAIVADPEARRAIGRALDEHYTKQASEATSRHREREIERKGGEDEYAEHEERQRLAEIVNVARGATSGWRFVAGQVKSVELDPGTADELKELAESTEGFVSMIRSLLRGAEITDEDIAELIGDQA
jgi:hypothetical protein